MQRPPVLVARPGQAPMEQHPPGESGSEGHACQWPLTGISLPSCTFGSARRTYTYHGAALTPLGW